MKYLQVILISTTTVGTSAQATYIMVSMTTVVQITSNPSTITLVNAGVASATLGTPSGGITTNNYPVAYMKIIKLQ